MSSTPLQRARRPYRYRFAQGSSLCLLTILLSLSLQPHTQAQAPSLFLTLQDFHDRFMQQGAPPIRIVRRALLQDDSPTL